ncbi:uncharacterized protein [Miscanthus floridulus]|uniref:uncharacterized protein n=1 Tax=Miscanthus floridulus TaxID=154761 RepID=UPI00345943A5
MAGNLSRAMSDVSSSLSEQCNSINVDYSRLIKNLILDSNNHKKLPQTVASFFYDSENDNQNFTSVVRGVRPRSLKFLPFNIDNVALSDYYNGLILCRCLGADGYRYVIYNPMTQKFKILPPSTPDVGHAVGEARLAFDLTASSHFHVIEYVDVNSVCAGVDIYLSQTTAWIYKESKWGEYTDVTFS